MSSMRLGKGPKRFHTKEGRRLQDAAQPIRNIAAEVRSQSIPPTEGPVSIFLDDERACPTDYTLARSPAAFHALIETVGEGRVAHLALDWHLGCGVPNGEKIAEDLAVKLKSDPCAFPALTIVSLHSSDRGRARSMLEIIESALEARDPELPEVAVILCSAEETSHVKRLLR